MSNTSSIRMINLEMIAEDQQEKDRAAGITTGVDYTWHGTQQIYPTAMRHDPEGYAQGLRAALPLANTIRMAFNQHSFNADGSLHPEFERFLVEAAKQGFQIVFNYADYDLQKFNGKDLTLDQMRSVLTGSAHDRFVATWDKMFDWLDGHSTVKDAIYGLEGMNEPQAYSIAQQKSGTGEFVQLYGTHMAEFADMVHERVDAKVMVSAMGYGQNLTSMANTLTADGSMTVTDQIREAAGEDLVWSAHLYPHWYDSKQSLEGVAALLKQQYGIVGTDDVIVTETNVDNHSANTIGGDASFWLARGWEAFQDAGIGIGWWTGASFGPAALASQLYKGSITFSHTGSYAHAMNAYLLGAEDAAHAGAETVTATKIAGRVLDVAGVTRPGLEGIALGIGYGGDDTITGIGKVVNMLYGGTGNDSLVAMDQGDELFGQAGNDTLVGGIGVDNLMGGDGTDKLYSGAGDDVLTGGRGLDYFYVDGGGSDIIADYSLIEADKLMIGGAEVTVAQLDSKIVMVDADSDTFLDDAQYSWSDGTVTLINYKVLRPDGIVNGTSGNDIIRTGYTDINNDTLVWKGGIVDAGDGNDSVVASESGDTVLGGFGNDTVNGYSGNDNVAGGFGDDMVYGWSGDDRLKGDAGNDRVIAGGGNDTMFGGTGNDTLIGTTGQTIMFGEDGDDLFDAGSTKAVIYGGTGKDTFMLTMKEGAKLTVSGEAGPDVFLFKQTSNNGHSDAVVTDFEVGVDSIKFDNLSSFKSAMKSSLYESFTDVGADAVLKFGGDTYTFKNHHVADFL